MTSSIELQAAYRLLALNCGIEVGDEVRILRPFSSNEMGFGAAWNPGMNPHIHGVYIVSYIETSTGYFTLEGVSWVWPFLVLELVTKGKQFEVNKGVFVQLRSEGPITFPATTISREKIVELAKLLQTATFGELKTGEEFLFEKEPRIWIKNSRDFATSMLSCVRIPPNSRVLRV